MKRFRQALCFLTTLPIPYPQALSIAEIGKAASWFPFVGLVIGGLLVGADYLLRLVFPPFPAAFLLTIVWVVLTGGLHLDGLADCGDGLLVSAGQERRLEILKDSRIGSFGAISLILHLGLKITLAAALPLSIRWIALLSAPMIGRSLMVFTTLQPNARPGGLGEIFKSGLPSRWKFIPWLIIIPIIPLVFSGWFIIPALLFPLGCTAWVVYDTRKKLGGITGDVLGLVTEISESAVLLAFTIKFFL